MNLLKNFWREDRGQDVVEYTLLMAALTLACAAVVIGVGRETTRIWSIVNKRLANAN